MEDLIPGLDTFQVQQLSMVMQNLSVKLAWLSVISIPGENLIFHSDDSQICHIFLALIWDPLHLQLEI